MSTEPTARAWVEIDARALRRNLQRLRAEVGDQVALIPMVKADAYGLGASEAVRALEPEAPAGWGVATVDEGLALRAMGVVRPIYVFAPVTHVDLSRALRGGLIPTLSNLHDVDAWIQAQGGSSEAPFSVEIDTGMGRAGFPAAGVAAWAPQILARIGATGPGVAAVGATGSASRGLGWLGVFTHLHSADEPGLKGSATVHSQISTFRAALAVLDPLCVEARHPRLHRHFANSAAAMRFPEALQEMDAVRPGIFLYGGGVGEGAPEPEAVVAVRARVIRVAKVPPGTPLGYGSTYQSQGQETWATLGIGYGDGVPRALSNRGSVLVRGVRLPIIGRISMDVTVVDSSELGPLEVGEVATLVGASERNRIALSEVAEQAGTIHYEVLTGLTRRLPRVWSHVDSAES